MLRSGLDLLGRSELARKLIPRVPVTRAMSRRFVAGESVEDFVRVVRAARNGGLEVTGNYLGEAVADPERAGAAAEQYVQLLRRLREEGLNVNVSVKPSQLGMDVSASALLANVRALLEGAVETDAFVRLDMESSAYTQRTLDLFRVLWAEGHRNVGVVLQACLRRTAADLDEMIGLGASVRLCKGAYAEPSDLAFEGVDRIRASFRDLMLTLLARGRAPAIATHDEGLISEALRYVREAGIDRSRFEFQLLYGVRRDLQRELMGRGHRVRIYIPFGANWYPYLMRRLAERPENVLFLVGSVIRESPLGAILPGRRGLEGAE